MIGLPGVRRIATTMAATAGAAVLVCCAQSSSAQESLVAPPSAADRSEEHTSELQSPYDLVCRLLLEKKKPHHSILKFAFCRYPVRAHADHIAITAAHHHHRYVKEVHERLRAPPTRVIVGL